MNSKAPTLEEVITAAAALITQARAAGLTPPCALSSYDFGPPMVTFYVHVPDGDGDAHMAALSQWAGHYRTHITLRESEHGNTHALAKFTRDGITYEAYTVIRPAENNDYDPEEDAI